MVYSLSSPIKPTREELHNTKLNNQYKLDNSLNSVNPELLELKPKFTKIELYFAASRNINVTLVER